MGKRLSLRECRRLSLSPNLPVPLLVLLLLLGCSFLLYLLLSHSHTQPHSLSLSLSSSRSGSPSSTSTTDTHSHSSSLSLLWSEEREAQWVSESPRHVHRERPKPIQFRRALNYSVITDAWTHINGPWTHWNGVGFCNNGTSVIDLQTDMERDTARNSDKNRNRNGGNENAEESVCFRRDCLFSSVVHAYIDLNMLREFQLDPTDVSPMRFANVMWQGDLKQCRKATGGQAPSNAHIPGFTPEVSYLYTLHNNPDISAQAILEVFRTAHEAESIEYVVVYDGSSEDMSLVSNLLENLRYFFHVSVKELTHKKSKGYLISNNVGMRKARGEYAVLLNSDVLVLPGWLKMLLRTMKTHRGGNDKIGMVGSMMLNSDGKIMEVGGSVFADGQPINSGRGYFPHELSQHYSREVDYISAACLLVRRELFISLGLFDMQYAPAYYEDTDAAFTLVQQGWKTLIQPFSVVLHFEGTTYGTSGTSKVKDDLMKSNALRFYENHKNVFNKHCPPINFSSPSRTENHLNVHMGMTFYRQPNRVLILEDVVPEPDRDAGSIRLYEILHILTELGFTVTFEPQPITGRSIRYVLPLLADGINVVMPGTLRDMAEGSRTPLHDTIKAMRGNVCPWDLLIIARRDVFQRHLTDVQQVCPHIPIIFDTVDVHFIRELRMFSVKHKTTNAIKLVESVTTAQTELIAVLESQRKELNLMKLANITIVVSTEEKRILKNLLGSTVDVRIISNIYKVGDEREDSKVAVIKGSSSSSATGDIVKTQQKRNVDDERSGAIFVGNMCHTPNVDAVEFIVNNVLKDPSRLPADFKMHFVWSRSLMCKNEILVAAEKNPLVVVHRDVSNEYLYTLHKKVKVVLAPLRYGAGVKGKVNYALLHGVPVIATKVASEGMGLVNEKNFLLAESGEDFVDAIVRLYQDSVIFEQLVQGGRDIMREMFGRDIAKGRIKKAINDLDVVVKVEHPQCPFVKEFELLNWGSYWTSTPSTPQTTFFPLYPRIPFNNKLFLNYV